MRDKVLKEGGLSDSGGRIRHAVKYVDLRLEDGTLIIKWELWYLRDDGSTSPPRTLTHHIPLKKLRPEVTVSRVSGGYEYLGATVSCAGGEKLIKLVRLKAGANSETEEVFESFASVSFQSEELARRFANALSHAIKLSGGTNTTNEPF